MPGIYGATKAFVLTFSQSLQAELGARGLYVQAVLPSATRTEIWARSGRDVNQIPGVMDVDELVDAALLGFDRREAITIPSLPDAGQWDAFSAARVAMLPNFRQEHGRGALPGVISAPAKTYTNMPCRGGPLRSPKPARCRLLEGLVLKAVRCWEPLFLAPICCARNCAPLAPEIGTRFEAT